jgi:alpha-beta hydrolase superfamily lysophospholipase
MADLPIPSPVALPLAWITAQLYSRPRGAGPGAASARRAVAAYGGPVLVAQGDADEIVPVRDMRILERAARGRSGADATTEVLLVAGGAHRWLYEFEQYRRGVASFLSAALGGACDPGTASAAAAAVVTARPAGTDDRLIPERAVRGRTTTAA